MRDGAQELVAQQHRLFRFEAGGLLAHQQRFTLLLRETAIGHVHRHADDARDAPLVVECRRRTLLDVHDTTIRAKEAIGQACARVIRGHAREHVGKLLAVVLVHARDEGTRGSPHRLGSGKAEDLRAFGRPDDDAALGFELESE